MFVPCRRCRFSRLGKIVWYSVLTVVTMFCFSKLQIEQAPPTLPRTIPKPNLDQAGSARFYHQGTVHGVNNRDPDVLDLLGPKGPENVDIDGSPARRNRLGPHPPELEPSNHNGHLVNQNGSLNQLSYIPDRKPKPTTNPNQFRPTPTGKSQCYRRSHLVYIKTHKTGSCTTTNLIYRTALKYNWPTLQFVYFPYPHDGINRFYLHTKKFLESGGKKLRSTFAIAADHMKYERQEFNKVMEGYPLYTTTLRYPPNQLRSMFSYFDLGHKLNMKKEILEQGDPVEEYLLHYDNYPMPGLPYRVDNRNADILGFNRTEAQNTTKVQEFIEKIDMEFGLVMIKEYSDESNILLRRQMCWDMSDILYISINLRNYKKRQAGLKPQFEALHRKWNNVDYALYEHFNETLWRKIQHEGESFQKELQLYRKYLKLTQSYCEPMYDLLKKNKSQIFWLHKHMKPLLFPRTAFHEEFSIDVVFCTLARVDIAQFYMIMKVHSFPQICDFLDPATLHIEMNKFIVRPAIKKIQMNEGYCAPNPERTMVALEAIKTALFL